MPHSRASPSIALPRIRGAKPAALAGRAAASSAPCGGAMRILETAMKRGSPGFGGAAGWDEGEDEVVGCKADDEIEDGPRRGGPGGVRHGVARFDDPDARGRRSVAVAGHHEALERPAPMRLDGGGHRGGGLAGAD